MPITKFAGVLAKQLFLMANQQTTVSPFTGLPPPVTSPNSELLQTSEEANQGAAVGHTIAFELLGDTYQEYGHMEDSMNELHTVCLFQEKQQRNGKKYRNPQLCHLCRQKKSIVFCKQCKKCYCFPLRRAGAYSNLHMAQSNSCFATHVSCLVRQSPRKPSSNQKFEDIIEL